MAKLELKHISPYLPYNLRVKHISNGEIKVVNGIQEQFSDGTFILYWPEKYGTINASAYYQPILKPLSSLTPEDAIEVVKMALPGEKFKDVFLKDGKIFFQLKLKYSYVMRSVDISKLSLRVGQYLQSKCYDLPQECLDGKTLNEAGLAIYE